MLKKRRAYFVQGNNLKMLEKIKFLPHINNL